MRERPSFWQSVAQCAHPTCCQERRPLPPDDALPGFALTPISPTSMIAHDLRTVRKQGSNLQEHPWPVKISLN